MWEYKGIDHDNDWIRHFKYIDKKMINGKWRYIYAKAKNTLGNAITTETTTKYGSAAAINDKKTEKQKKQFRNMVVSERTGIPTSSKNDDKKKNKNKKNKAKRFIDRIFPKSSNTTSRTTHINGKSYNR